MSADTKDKFDASASLIGYLYQLRMALVLVLQRCGEDPAISVSIEKFDDIAFHAEKDVLEQLQTKHVSTKSLTDTSADLWKTLRVWAERVRAKTLDPLSTNLILLTTAEAPAGSAASYLRLKDRNPKKALEILEQVAETSVNQSNQKAYEQFRGLSTARRRNLVRSVYVHDLSPGIIEADKLLRHELRLVTSQNRIVALATRLEGWWLRKVIDHLAEKQHRITAEELMAELSDLREQFKLENLPIDYADLEVPATGSVLGQRFVQQLTIIELSHKRIALAVRDFFRATQQRSRWIGDHLVTEDELARYERNLTENWTEIFESVVQSADGSNHQKTGREIYDKVIVAQNLNLRPSCTAAYVMRGSYHMLADADMVGWHPQFREFPRTYDEK